MDAPDQDDGDKDTGLLEEDDNPRRKRPAAAYRGIEPAPLPPMALDGGPIPGAGLASPPPLPPATPDNFICLRGPCRYYWEFVSHLEAGNPESTWDDEHGLKSSMLPCPGCTGTGLVDDPRPLAATSQLAPQDACGYQPTQGSFAGKPCRLVKHHAGAHHHDPDMAPKSARISCPACNGTSVVPDPMGTPIKQPKQHNRSCLVQPGLETDITEDIVYACNRWDPVLPKDLKQLAERRRVYLKLFPQHAPKE